jgi:erythromycin esterase
MLCGLGRISAQTHAMHSIARLDSVRPTEWAPMLDAIGTRRIVLLGENGHGVSEFSTLKVGLIRQLHQRGYDLVLFESGLAECHRASRTAPDAPITAVLRRCLGYAFEHAEILPLFQRFRDSRTTPRPLEFGGMDLQIQGNDAVGRGAVFGDALRAIAPAMADTLLRSDSLLVARNLAGRDSLLPWVEAHGATLDADYRAAARQVTGIARLTLQMHAANLSRLREQADAAREGRAALSTEYYAVRDRWMAHAIAYLADSMGRQRKVIVWLHDDHARRDSLDTPAGRVRATGSYLAEWFPGQTFSLGFLMGGGEVADNSRRVRAVPTPPIDGLESLFAGLQADAGYVLMQGSLAPSRAWQQTERPYLRAGLGTSRLTPAAAFDALLYVRKVSPPNYRLP